MGGGFSRGPGGNNLMPTIAVVCSTARLAILPTQGDKKFRDLLGNWEKLEKQQFDYQHGKKSNKIYLF